jgi:iron complex outermembrane receptor protein
VSDRLQVAFRTAYDKRDFAAQNFYTPLVIDTATEKVETFWNQLQVAYTAARHTVRIQAGYKRLNDTYLLNRNFTANTNRSSLYQALLSDEWKVGSTTTLLTGTQVINKMIRSNDRGDHNVSQAAFFAVLNQQWGHLFVSPAARVEWNERSGWELIPQVNLSYRVAQWQLRASAGKTTRDADFTERFNNYNRPMVNSGGRIGNADLEAERSFSYEAGADYFLASSLKISGTFFRRHHTNLIDYVTTSYADMPRKSNLQVNGTYLLARNVAEVTTTGVETDIQFTKNWGKSGLWASTGFIWLNSKTSDAVPSLYLASHARYQVNFSAQYTHKWFAFGINGLFKERAEQTSGNAIITKVDKEYVVLNAKLEGFVLPGKVSAFIQADNLFDRSYTDLLGSRMPGRWWMGGIKILLSK